MLIPGDIYPFDVLVTTATHDETIKYIEGKKRYKLNDEEKEKLKRHGVGRTVMLEGGQTIVWVNPERTYVGCDVPTLVHELLHAVNFIFDRIGLRVYLTNDEAQTYFLQYLLRRVLAEWGK